MAQSAAYLKALRKRYKLGEFRVKKKKRTPVAPSLTKVKVKKKTVKHPQPGTILASWTSRGNPHTPDYYQ